MNNTDKLLRAFIEASGFEITDVQVPCMPVESEGMFFGQGYKVDYKVTKKPFDILSDDYTDEVMRLHKTIQETNTYNEELYKENLGLKKDIQGILKNDNT